MRAMRIVVRRIVNGRHLPPRSEAGYWLLRLATAGAMLGLLVALGAGAAVLAHPPLFAALRPWWPPLAAVGLLSTAASYWLL